MEVIEPAHAILSPSFLHIALKCSGSIRMKQGIPPLTPDLPAIKGTEIHSLGSKVLNDFLEYKVSGTDPNLHLNQETNVEYKKVASEWRSIVWEKGFEGSITGKAYGIEERLCWSERLSLWGTADVWIVSTDERACPYGMVIDLKSGFVFVDADKNPQLAAYACSLRKEVRALGKDLDYVRAAIYQPFASGEKFRSVKFTAKQLDAWEKKFTKLAEEAYKEKPKFKAGEHCKGCPANTRCETHHKFLKKETGLSLIEADKIVFPEVKGLPNEILVNVTKYTKQLEKFAENCKKELTEKLYGGEKIDGVKLVQAKTRRKWDVDKIGGLDSSLRDEGIELFEKVAKGLTEIKDALEEKYTKKEAEEFIKAFTVKPTGGLTLVESSDPREEVKTLSGLFIED